MNLENARGGPQDRLVATHVNTAESETSETFGTGELEAAIEGAAAFACDVPIQGNPFHCVELPALARAWARGWRRASELECVCDRQRSYWRRAA